MQIELLGVSSGFKLFHMRLMVSSKVESVHQVEVDKVLQMGNFCVHAYKELIEYSREERKSDFGTAVCLINTNRQ